MLFQCDVLKARWRIAEGEADRQERQASILAALRPLQKERKLATENERWFATARAELQENPGEQPPVSALVPVADKPSADTPPPK